MVRPQQFMEYAPDMPENQTFDILHASTGQQKSTVDGKTIYFPARALCPQPESD
jgi:hypothetical protein